MERNLTQSEYEAVNARRAANGKEPLTYRDANRQARRLTSRQRRPAAEVVDGPQEVSFEAEAPVRERDRNLGEEARPPTPPRSRRVGGEAQNGSGYEDWSSWWQQWYGQSWYGHSWQDWQWGATEEAQWRRDEGTEQAEIAGEGTTPREASSSAYSTEVARAAAAHTPQQEVSSSASERAAAPAADVHAERQPQPAVLPIATQVSATSSSGDVLPSAVAELKIDPTQLFQPPLSDTDLPEDKAVFERLSRLLTAALRHKPQDFDLHLQDDGFVDLEEVASKKAFRKHGASPRMLAAVSVKISKKRFIFRLTGRRVCVAASHGHSKGILRSLAIFEQLTVATAPELAYHATQFRKWAGIAANGLQSMDREHVHLALQADQESGLRQGQDLLLVVRARAMVAAGITLLRSATNVLLTPGVTSGGLLPLHFIAEICNIHTNRLHYVPPKAGECGSLLLEEGRLPPMPCSAQGGPAEWNAPSLWSHVRIRALPNMPRLTIGLNPTQLLLSFLSARGLQHRVDDYADVLAEEGDVWRGLRVMGSERASAEAETYYHGTHLYALPSILRNGLKPSTSADGTRTLHIGETPLDGVYSFTKLQQVLFYCPYILLPLQSLDMPPCTAAVRVSLELEAEPHANQRRGKRTHQYILDEHKIQLCRIWVQAKSPDTLQLGDAYTDWQPNLEAPV